MVKMSCESRTDCRSVVFGIICTSSRQEMNRSPHIEFYGCFDKDIISSCLHGRHDAWAWCLCSGVVAEP